MTPPEESPCGDGEMTADELLAMYADGAPTEKEQREWDETFGPLDPERVFPNDSCPRCGAPVVWRLDHSHIMEQTDPGAIRGDATTFNLEFTCCTVEYRAEICGDRFGITAILDPAEEDDREPIAPGDYGSVSGGDRA